MNVLHINVSDFSSSWTFHEFSFEDFIIIKKSIKICIKKKSIRKREIMFSIKVAGVWEAAFQDKMPRPSLIRVQLFNQHDTKNRKDETSHLGL